MRADFSWSPRTSDPSTSGPSDGKVMGRVLLIKRRASFVFWVWAGLTRNTGWDWE